MASDDVDKLLERYLHEESDGDVGKGRRGRRHRPLPAALGPRPEYGTGPELPAVRRALLGNLTDELEGLLGRYLETEEAVDAGGQTIPAFTLPRKPEVDDMLRRYRDGVGAGGTAEALRQSLAEHVEAVDCTRRAAGSTLDLERELQQHAWSKRTASDVHHRASFSDKVASYAEALDQEDALLSAAEASVEDAFFDDEDEDLYAFEPELKTLRGMPPGNAPPLSADDD